MMLAQSTAGEKNLATLMKHNSQKTKKEKFTKYIDGLIIMAVLMRLIIGLIRRTVSISAIDGKVRMESLTKQFMLRKMMDQLSQSIFLRINREMFERYKTKDLNLIEEAKRNLSQIVKDIQNLIKNREIRKPVHTKEIRKIEMRKDQLQTMAITQVQSDLVHP